jgi:spore coat polysaccharide biosynthesis protein SpsF
LQIRESVPRFRESRTICASVARDLENRFMMLLPEPSDHLRVIAIVEAYAGSGALDRAGDKQHLEHVLQRLRRSQFIERIAIATSTATADQAVVAFALDHDVIAIRGTDDDLLLRFARIAELLDADIVVRVTADAAPIDAGFVDHLVTALIEQDGDYLVLEGAARGIHPFTRRALDKLMMDAHDDIVARSGVTDYFDLHPDFGRAAHAVACRVMAGEGGDPASAALDDRNFVETMLDRMAARGGEASLSDLLALRDRTQRSRGRHAQVTPARAAGGKALALIRCDGGGRFGYGHAMRMVALARTLRDRHGFVATFAVNGTPDALEPIRHAGFEARPVDGARDFAVLADMIGAHGPEMLICDQVEGLSRNALAELAGRVPVVAAIDDMSERRLAAHFAYYAPLPQVAGLDWTGSHCLPRIGWQWSLLGLSKTEAPRRSALPRPTLLVTMGGSDPQELTLRVAEALAQLAPVFRARFVIGPGMKNGAVVARSVVRLAQHFETLEGADDLATEYAASDLALAVFGVTAYELGAGGVPALYLCLTEDAALSAQAFERAGMGLSLGLAAQAKDDDIAQAVWTLLADTPRRRQMRSAGLATLDGNGAKRIAADLAAALAGRRAAGAKRVAR